MLYILHIYYTYIIHITFVYIYIYIYIYKMAMTLRVSRVTFCLDMSLYSQLQSAVTYWNFIQVDALHSNKFLAVSIYLFCSFHYQLCKVFRVWGEVNLVRLGNLPVKFEWFLPDWNHFIFNWIEGIIFPYISNLTFADSYDRGFFIDTYIVWIMVLGWW